MPVVKHQHQVRNPWKSIIEINHIAKEPDTTLTTTQLLVTLLLCNAVATEVTCC